MPIYEYRCASCKTVFSERRRMGEADAPATCPACESHETRRVLSLFAAHGSDGVVAGTSGGCSTCTSGTCSTCGSHS
ncbi:MAG: hypothetical protein Kow00120_14120 [Anaerolineae bacterium]